MPTTIAVIASIVVLMIILHDAFEVMLLPRRVKSPATPGPGVLPFYLVNLVHTGAPHQLRGPASQLFEFVWASFDGVVAGGLGKWTGSEFWNNLLGAPAGKSGPLSWPNQIYFSGVTFFTLGYGDVLPHTGLEKVLAVLEAGTGLGFIAIVIGYLPVLYQLFAQREAKVIMLDATAR